MQHQCKILVLIILLLPSVCFAQVWQSDLENGKYKNPIIYADYSDPDIVKVGDDFYMTSSSFNCVPALPILHSTDLVNWEIINYAVEKFPDSWFDVPQHGNGVWAPCIRYHDGWFYIYWGDPDRGIYMVRTQDPKGQWEVPVLVKRAKGNIDASPLWDDDGKVYLVHAFANSRAGVSHVLQLQELTADGAQVTKNRDIIIHGLPDNMTLEGPKFYKRNGYYYIFAPAGGVPTGWQMVYRSKDIWGPYEEKRVLETGPTDINGPHQGGWVELDNGECWFVHFQELQPYGRIVHLQPMKWENDWPVMGEDKDGNGVGNPVLTFKKPNVNGKSEIKVPQATDEFNSDTYNLAWQWQANYQDHWYSLKDNPGHLRLYSQYNPNSGSLWMVPSIIAQKFSAPEFTVSTKINVSGLKEKEKAGLMVVGTDYMSLSVRKKGNGTSAVQLSSCKNAFGGYTEIPVESTELDAEELLLQVTVNKGGMCQFAVGISETDLQKIGKPMQAKEGRWIGSKIGLYAISTKQTGIKGHADFDWFRIK